MAEDRPILNALKQALAALIPVLLQFGVAWMTNKVLPTSTAPTQQK